MGSELLELGLGWPRLRELQLRAALMVQELARCPVHLRQQRWVRKCMIAGAILGLERQVLPAVRHTP